MGLNPVSLVPDTKGKFGHRDRHTQVKGDVKTAISRPRREARNRFFPYSPQKKPMQPTP